jgi:two-component system, response regulator, stage 0 sporulation protein A
MKPDVLLLDIVMPEMDGFGVLEALNEMEYCQRPTISILSVLRNDVIVQRAMELGADYYISKTISTSDMVKRIFDLIGLNRIDHTTSETVPGKRVNVSDPILPTQNSEELVKKTLQQLGLPQHLLGYKYLKDAVIMSLSDQAILNGVTKKLYPEIARKYNTTSARVERSMRHSIEVTWIKGDIDILNRYFGYTVNAEKGKPTNSEFIALLSDRINMSMAR